VLKAVKTYPYDWEKPVKGKLKQITEKTATVGKGDMRET
jgi:hypothetical protein